MTDFLKMTSFDELRIKKNYLQMLYFANVCILN